MKIGDMVLYGVWYAVIEAFRCGGKRVVIRLIATGKTKTVSIESVSNIS